MAKLQELARTLCCEAVRQHRTVATAESCTGGGVGAAITAIPGASAFFAGGITAYANAAKMRLLNVPAAVLERHGAVSPECARAMAEGARRVFGTDLAVSITGIAGPGGSGAGKPAGLVFMAVATGKGTPTHEFHFSGGRAAVRRAAKAAALDLLLAALR